MVKSPHSLSYSRKKLLRLKAENQVKFENIFKKLRSFVTDAKKYGIDPAV
jgi:hypothetical protein